MRNRNKGGQVVKKPGVRIQESESESGVPTRRDVSRQAELVLFRVEESRFEVEDHSVASAVTDLMTQPFQKKTRMQEPPIGWRDF